MKVLLVSLFSCVVIGRKRALKNTSHRREQKDICFEGGDDFIPAGDTQKSLMAYLHRDFHRICNEFHPFSLHGSAMTDFEKEISAGVRCTLDKSEPAFVEEYYKTCVIYGMDIAHARQVVLDRMTDIVAQKSHQVTSWSTKSEDLSRVKEEYDWHNNRLIEFKGDSLHMPILGGYPLKHACQAFIYWVHHSEFQNGLANTREANDVGSADAVRDAAFVRKAANNKYFNFCLVKVKCRSDKSFTEVVADGILYEGNDQCSS